MSHYVYILQSEKDSSFYIGCSENPKRRLEKHNLPHKGYSARKQPWKLVYTEVFESKTEALKRVNFLKRQKNREIQVGNLIQPIEGRIMDCPKHNIFNFSTF